MSYSECATISSSPIFLSGSISSPVQFRKIIDVRSHLDNLQLIQGIVDFADACLIFFDGRFEGIREEGKDVFHCINPP